MIGLILLGQLVFSEEDLEKIEEWVTQVLSDSAFAQFYKHRLYKKYQQTTKYNPKDFVVVSI